MDKCAKLASISAGMGKRPPSMISDRFEATDMDSGKDHNKATFCTKSSLFDDRRMTKSKFAGIAGKDKFGFMSFNVLADSLLARDMYPQASKHHEASYRLKSLMAAEIDPLSPDIICMQEKQSTDVGMDASLAERGYAVGSHHY